MPDTSINLDPSGQPVVSFQIPGGQDFMALDKAQARRVARSALREGGQEMLAAIRGRVHNRSGLLESSLKLRPGKGDAPGRISMLISAWSTAEEFAATREMFGRGAEAAGIRGRFAGKDKAKYSVYYALFVEAGHAGPFGSANRTPAHSFARAGFDETVEAAAGRIEDSLMEGIANA